ncbi:MAG: CxxxxCH/CxxCH domain c-type cytochrome, partial [Desulfuromonadales bacterium]
MNSASNLGLTPTKQTSHFWSSPKDVMPAAGALAPSRSLYISSYGISTGKVTCTRCHDPHLPSSPDNSKLLRMTEVGDKICLDCHRPWDTIKNPSLQRGLLTHPLVADYAVVAAANPTKYKANVANVGSGDVKLLAGGVTCTSCHGTHFTDSHSGTVDGRDNRAGLQAGDGKLLRSDGPKREGDTAADTAQLRSNLCQACHTYKTHGDANPIGCLACHSGHVYDQSNPTTPNYFVLRTNISNVWMPKSLDLDKRGNVVGAKFRSTNAEWMNAGGDGYCQSCHRIDAPHNALSSGNAAADSCGACHYHGHAERSFTASCADCHGTPPISNSPGAGGYAFDNTLNGSGHNYSTSTVYKDESTTPHGSHAGGDAYRFSCDVCHLGKTHNDKVAGPTFQDVFKTAHPLASGSGATAPSYNGVSGTCSAVYCHSNGGARGAAPVVAPGDEWGNGVWANGKGVISSKPLAARCKSCHGNDSASMTARSNSASHQKHLAKYSCNVCHKNTAASATALIPAAINGMHVNGLADVFFDLTHNLGADTLKVGATPYTPATGTCSVYCHSNGAGNYATPDWDVTTSGDCGTCHGARVGDAAVIASGAHAKHVSDVNGPQLGCDACHGANANTASHAGHVNGMVNAPAASVCTSCHAVDSGETTPVWTIPASSTCESCHGGATVSVIGGKTAPTKPLAAGSGHNKPSGSYSLSGKNAANKTCVACHDAAAAGHFGTSGDSRLSVGFSCSSCHPGVLTHQAKACVACHDPHGTSNGYMIYSSQATQNAKDTSASGKFSGNVVFTAKTGANSYDEDDAGVGGGAP